MKMHWGLPDYTGCFRFHHGTILAKGQRSQEVYFEQPIRSWFGFSVARFFIGVIRVDRTRDVREPAGRRALESQEGK